MIGQGRKPPDARESAPTRIGLGAAEDAHRGLGAAEDAHRGNGGDRHETPSSGTVPIADMSAEARSIYAAEAAKQASEDSAVTRRMMETLVRRVHHDEQYREAMKTAIVGLSGQMHENRKLTAQQIDRLEGRMVIEFARIAKRIEKAESDAADAKESAGEAEEWASKSGQRDMTELQKRASKSETFFEDLARKKLELEEKRELEEIERRREERVLASEKTRAIVGMWSKVAASVFTAGGVGTLIVIALTRGCGG